MMGWRKWLWLGGLVVLLGGCATPPFDASAVDESITPQRAVDEAPLLSGRQVLWGGVVIAATNLPDATRLEVLSYPLDRNQRPMTGQRAGARFLVYRSGYLETAEYAPGRQVSVVGTLSGVEQGTVGETAYRYPVVREPQLELWPELPIEEPQPRLHFGIGVIFGR